MANGNIKRLLARVYQFTEECDMENTYSVEVEGNVAQSMLGNTHLLNHAVSVFERETGWEMISGELLFGDDVIQRVGVFQRGDEIEEMVVELEL